MSGRNTAMATAAAIIPSIVFSIVIMRTTKDTTLVALFRDAQHTD